MNYEEIKNKIYQHQGTEAGQSQESFYITTPDQTTYEVTPAVYYIWKLADGTKTIEQITQQASKELQIPTQELQEPITQITQKLLENKLLTEKTQ